jgi:hypothetical protein
VAVEDNGEGFDLKNVDPSRNGLTNMVERMKEVGGECRIAARPGAGCRVEFQMPLPKFHRRPSGSNPGNDPALAAIRGIPSSPQTLNTGKNHPSS